jgi:stringent starvation protein B
MKYRMPPLPRKQAVALDLLERTSVFVHLDPRRPGVIVPQGFLKQPQLVLQIGLNMAIAIPDLDVGEEGISCTLSFNKRPHFCRLPWSAIYALIGEQGGGMVWPEDVPPEVVSQQRAAAKKEAKPRKPGLRAISGEAADRNSDPPASTRRSDTPRPAEVRRELRGSMLSKEVLSKEVSSKDMGRPPRLVQVVSNPTSADSANPGASVSQRSEPQRPEQVPASSRDDAPNSKRSRPPYLRLVD